VQLFKNLYCLRDGKYPGAQVAKGTQPEEIVSHIAGRQLASERKGSHQKGILGIRGLQGAWRTEVLVNGKNTSIGSPKAENLRRGRGHRETVLHCATEG
jgi:hypothetical protein